MSLPPSAVAETAPSARLLARHAIPLVLLISLLGGSARAATFIYPDPGDPDITNWDATAGIAGGDTVELQRNATYSSSVSPITNNGTLAFDVSGSSFNNLYEFSLPMSGTGGVSLRSDLGGSFVSLTGANTYTGGTTIAAGSGLVGTTASLTGAITNQGVVRFQQDSNGTFAGAITGGGIIERYGQATVTLTGTNATAFYIYNDGFGGRLVGNTDSLKGEIQNTGGTLEFNQTSDGAFLGNFGTFDTGAVYKTGAGALAFTGNNRLQSAGQSNLFIDAGRVEGPAESLDFNGTVTIAAGAEMRIIDSAVATSFIQSNITGAGRVYKTGTNSVDLSQGTNTYTGGTEVIDGKLLFRYQSLPGALGTYGPVLLSGSGSTNTVGISIDTGNGTPGDQEYSATITGPGSLTVTGGSYLNLTSTSNAYTGGSFVDATARLVGTTQTIPGAVTLLGIGSGVEYRQVTNATSTALISGTGDIYKTGTGSLTLATNTSLAGNIAVLEGTLVVNNQMVNIDLVRVNGLSAVLKGSGTLGTAGVSRGIDVELGVLSPGNSAGILTATSLDLSGGGTAIEWELMGNTASGRGTSFDGIDLNGDLTIASGSVLDLVFNAAGSNVSWFNSFWDTNQSWVMIDGIVNATVAQDVFTTFNLSNDSVGRSLGEFRPGAGFTAAYDNVNGEVVINYTAAQLVPEPSTLILAAAAGLGGLAFLRRRRRAAAE